jgi:RNA polymerase sigma factor (sigma-70 family)
MDAEDQARDLVARLRRLPRKHRDVVGLCLVAGLTYEEAAVALGVPVGTVRSRLARGRLQLAELAVEDRVDMRPLEKLTTRNGA